MGGGDAHLDELTGLVDICVRERLTRRAQFSRRGFEPPSSRRSEMFHPSSFYLALVRDGGFSMRISVLKQKRVPTTDWWILLPADVMI